MFYIRRSNCYSPCVTSIQVNLAELTRFMLNQYDFQIKTAGVRGVSIGKLVNHIVDRKSIY